MRTLVTAFGLLPALALGAGCFSAELDAPDVCVGGLAVPFPANSFDAATDETISADDLGVPDSDQLDLRVEVRSLAVAPLVGVTDLDFVSALSVHAAAADPASALPEMPIIDMDAADMQDDGTLFAETPDPVDITDYLLAGDVRFIVNAAGEEPEMDWAAAMELCVHANAHYEKP